MGQCEGATRVIATKVALSLARKGARLSAGLGGERGSRNVIRTGGDVRRPPCLFCPSERTEIAADRPLIGDPETFALVIGPITGG